MELELDLICQEELWDLPDIVTDSAHNDSESPSMEELIELVLRSGEESEA